MQYTSILTVVFALLSLASARRGRRHGSSSTEYDTTDTTQLSSDSLNSQRKKNSWREAHHVPVLTDVGFYAFDFGKRNQPVRSTFHFVLTRTAYISVTDCFCEGDAFAVADNGVQIFNTMNNCPAGPFKCKNFEANPWVCLNEKRFCSGGAFMLPGAHNITITPTTSVANGGTGFLRVDTMCEDPVTRQLVYCCVQSNNCVRTIFSS